MTLDAEALFRAMGDTTRLRALMLLKAHGELCVCELSHALAEIQPKISRHVAMLREAGIVLDRRDGQWIHYRINPALPAWARKVLAAAAEASAKPYARDQQRLKGTPNRPPARCV